MGEEDTVSKRIRYIEYKNVVEYIPSGSDCDDEDNEDELESYNDDDDELERRGRWWSSRARKRTNYKGDRQYESESFTRLKSD